MWSSDGGWYLSSHIILLFFLRISLFPSPDCLISLCSVRCIGFITAKAFQGWVNLCPALAASTSMYNSEIWIILALSVSTFSHRIILCSIWDQWISRQGYLDWSEGCWTHQDSKLVPGNTFGPAAGNWKLCTDRGSRPNSFEPKFVGRPPVPPPRRLCRSFGPRLPGHIVRQHLLPAFTGTLQIRVWRCWEECFVLVLLVCFFTQIEWNGNWTVAQRPPDEQADTLKKCIPAWNRGLKRKMQPIWSLITMSFDSWSW